jgi:LmbE family N-acetylglucosaminyl deacetylase
MSVILVIAPHADDETIAMGGTIARLASEGHSVVVAVLTGHGQDGPHPLWPKSAWAQVREECQLACQVLGVEKILFRELPAACLDALPAWQVNAIVDEVLQEVEPDDVYIPFAFDLHKDHRVINYAVHVSTRPYLPKARKIKRLLAYETLSETHLAAPFMEPAFQPNIFVNIEATLEKKLEAMQCYASQLQPANMPRSIDALRALATYRGNHIGCYAAEAFILLGQYVR